MLILSELLQRQHLLTVTLRPALKKNSVFRIQKMQKHAFTQQSVFICGLNVYGEIIIVSLSMTSNCHQPTILPLKIISVSDWSEQVWSPLLRVFVCKTIQLREREVWPKISCLAHANADRCSEVMCLCREIHTDFLAPLSQPCLWLHLLRWPSGTKKTRLLHNSLRFLVSTSQLLELSKGKKGSLSYSVWLLFAECRNKQITVE